MELQRKLEILADAAKYDASCASCGTELRDSSDGKDLGSTAPGMGICHSYAPDGRCISLLKVQRPTPATTTVFIASIARPPTSYARASRSMKSGAQLKERFKMKATQLGFGF
jgi:hypothetical protein